jgi:peptidyl-prolyl cis-trans isomerase SurA
MGSPFIAAAGRRAYKSGNFSIQRGPIILIRITTRFLLGLAIAVLVLASGPLHAQETLRIAAVVNDEVISIYDLVNRTRLAIMSSGLPDTPETRRRVQPQVLRALIDEKIQAQEAARQNVTATEADMQAAIARIEENNRMPPGGLERLIANSGIERSAVMGQIRANVLWQKLVNRRLRNTLQVGDDEVDEQLARLKAAQGTPEYLLAEIFLAVDSPEQDDEVRQAAIGLTEQLRRGTPFPDMARQFSQSASAASGGDIGWVQSGMLEADVEAAIERTPPGQLTDPVRSVGGYYIYAVRQRRIIAAASPNDATVTLVQMLLPFESGGAPAEIDSLKELADTVRESVSGCADLKRVSEELKVPPPTDPQRLRVGDLAPRIRDLVSPLKVGEASPPIQIERGLLLLMVCQREDAPSNMPTREDITENLLRQRLDLLSRRYLRDLRRAAFVDVRV